MKGVAANLAAQAGTAAAGPRAWARRGSSDEAPLADVLGLMVREKLTGEKPPASLAARWICGGLSSRNGRRRSRQAGGRAARPEGLCPADPHHAEPSGAGRSTDSDSLRTKMPKAKIPKARMTRARTRKPSQDGESAATEFAADRSEDGEEVEAEVSSGAVRRPGRRRPSRKTAPSPTAMRRLSPIRTNGATRSSPPNSTRRSPPPISARPRN